MLCVGRFVGICSTQVRAEALFGLSTGLRRCWTLRCFRGLCCPETNLDGSLLWKESYRGEDTLLVRLCKSPLVPLAPSRGVTLALSALQGCRGPWQCIVESSKYTSVKYRLFAVSGLWIHEAGQHFQISKRVPKGSTARAKSGSCDYRSDQRNARLRPGSRKDHFGLLFMC